MQELPRIVRVLVDTANQIRRSRAHRSGERRAPTDEERDQALVVLGERVTRDFFSGRGTVRRASRSGALGDPAGSAAELGRRYIDQIEDATVRLVEHVEQMFEVLPERTQ
jgi:creatinine amidohydrolase/Fe(II)-dependent formamide hydrolase-like protein